MSGTTLTQGEIDRLLSSMRRKPSQASAAEPDVSFFDFRTPSKFPSSFVREFSEMHQAFGRVLSEGFTRELRVPVTVEVVGTEQLTYEAYIRSMPNPSILTVVALDPLPGLTVVEISAQLGLVLVDRMLGGPGRPVAPRQPTQLEETLIGSLLDHPMAALGETFGSLMEIEPRFVTSEQNPSFAHAANPGEMVLVVTFSLVADSTGPASRGLISVGYPLTILNPIRDAMRQARWSGGMVEHEGAPKVMEAILADAPVTVSARTRPTSLPAAALAALRPGDVITFDHAVDEPLVGHVEEVPFMRLGLGRQGQELAARVEGWT